MKKQLFSILALILCFCTVFVFASCGKGNKDNESDSESLGESNESFDVEDGLQDVDSVTAEDIFAEMKAAYKATLDYKNAYSLSIDWVEDQTDAYSGSDTENETEKNKIVNKEVLTADPTTGKAAVTFSEERYENNKKISSTTQESKYFSQNNKNYMYSASTADGVEEFSYYNSFSDYGFEALKEEMLLSSTFGAESHFEESFGDPFAATSASDLKTIYTTVINELKSAEKARYEAEGYTVKALNAKADVIFNTDNGVNIFKRTITVSSNLQDNGGTYQNNLTVESLLKTKDGKILSFVSTSTRSDSEKVGDTYNHQADTTSSLSYNFTYSMNDSAYNAIKTSLPAAGVMDAPDYFESPLTLVVGGNEVAITVIGEMNSENTVADVLNGAINEIFADSAIEFDGNWYTDAACTKKLDVSTITTVEKLQAISKLYCNALKVSSSHALFIDSGKEVVNVPKNYTIVFGNGAQSGTLPTDVTPIEYDENNNMYRVSYEAKNPKNVSIKINGTALKYDADPEKSDIQEESAGEFFHEFVFEGGKVYFINRTNTVDKTSFSLSDFFVSF
jgi:hypothetical protein